MKVIELSKGTNIEVAVLLGGFYGLRRSECVGLRWEAIDFESNSFYINHTVTTPRIGGKKKVIIAKDTAILRQRQIYTLILIPAQSRHH